MKNDTKYTRGKQALDPIYPAEWSNELNLADTHIAEYLSLQHFKYHVKTLTQKEDEKTGVSYAEALRDLVSSKPTMSQGDYQVILNRVKNNLLKRGLISEHIYESYKYDVEGDIVDVGKLIGGDPQCCLVPNYSYTNHFYELYISVSYPYTVSDTTITENMAKILATVQLLEQQHIYCKLSLVLPNKNCSISGKQNYLAIIPLFSHRDPKTIETMSSVLNERLLRKFFFAIWEDMYGSNLASGYGHAHDLTNAITPVDLDECELASKILDQIIVPGTR